MRLNAPALALTVVLALSSLSAQESPQDPLLRWMNRIAQHDLQQREKTVDQIHTIAQAERRKKLVRTKFLEALGGLPNYHGPLHARTTGSINAGSYTIEKVIYDSLPGFYVTANLYRPNKPGRYPAVLLQSGHTQEGKPESQRLAANLALKGFVVLCFDPIGQGEREQTYSRQLKAPLAGWSVPEHTQMDAQAFLIGEGLSRYFIWDAMRSLDYLDSLPEVDPSRIGATGCSGGGALTTFIGGMDPRIRVVIPGCYPSSFQLLFASEGPDSEMMFPRLLVSGLDTADFVELSAPTPWLLQSTEHDEYHFTPQGVRLVYEEARNWYSIYGASNRVGFMIGPGSHGMPLVAREAVYKWMIRWLKNGQGDFHEQPVKMYTSHELQATASGNVEDLPGSRKLYQILLEDFHAKERPGTIPELMNELRNLKIPTDRSAPNVKVLDDWNTPAGRRKHISFESESGIWIDGTLLIPPSSGRKPAVLVVGQSGRMGGVMPVDDVMEQMARMGRVVLQMNPRHSSEEIGNESEGPMTGDWMSNLAANLIGRNLPAMRAHDILRGVDLLAARSDVDPHSIRAFARGVPGVWLLLAAATDPRIEKIWLDRTPYSLRLALENSLSRDLFDAVVPGFILHWDFDDLVNAMGSRTVLWTDPTNWMGRVVAVGPKFQYRYVLGDTTDFANAQDKAYIRELLN